MRASWGSCDRKVEHVQSVLMQRVVPVLAAGGYNYEPLASAELYDPLVRSWASTADMVTGRQYFRMVLLADGTGRNPSTANP